MKKIILSCCALAMFLMSIAQSDYIKRPAIGFYFFYNDFRTPADVRAQSLATIINKKAWADSRQMSHGFSFSYLEGLTNHLDFEGNLAGSYVKYPVPEKKLSFKEELLLEISAAANLKLTSDKYWFTPFLTLGAGASKYKGYYGAFVPAGVGLQLNLWDEVFLLSNAQYRIPVTANVAYHVYYTMGIAGNIGNDRIEKGKALPIAPVAEAPKDKDGDAVLDADDACPDVAGLASLKGCPDKDSDGIADGDDKCPDVSGLAKYGGCPIPDTDKDGINDELDKCIDVAGVARYNGCPIPDTDSDGVNDEEDKCPAKAGPASNFGCPVIAKAVVDKINYAAGNIFFATGSAKLLAKSNKPLNDVAKILAVEPSLKLDIEGHTDNTGKPDKNKVLSQNRADAVKNYLKAKGIDESRLTATGFGQEKPVADNKTAAGKAKNRRVEMKARNY